MPQTQAARHFKQKEGLVFCLKLETLLRIIHTFNNESETYYNY
jgi:hypothetical protein